MEYSEEELKKAKLAWDTYVDKIGARDYGAKFEVLSPDHVDAWVEVVRVIYSNK